MSNEKHIMQGRDYDAFIVEWRGEGEQTQYLSLNNINEIVWVDEVDDAIHFARRSDAERMVDDAPDELDIHICGHRWCGGVPRDRVVRQSEWRNE